jgi:hypothetical protein
MIILEPRRARLPAIQPVEKEAPVGEQLPVKRVLLVELGRTAIA